MLTTSEPSHLPQPCCLWRPVATVVAVCVLCFATLAPLLHMMEFSNGGENAVVASVQEMHRGGPWLVPTLQDEQRTKKPPLATWLAALATQKATTAKFNSLDPAERDAAFRDFAWQVRWPSLAAMCGVILATATLGNLIGGKRLAVIAAAVCGGNLFWLQSARLATTDSHLALWVGVANCLFAAGIFQRKWRLALIGGGAALGMAMMSKGPVALLQTVLPILAFVAWRRWHSPGGANDQPKTSAKRLILPLMLGVLLFAAIGLSWYLLVMWKNPAVWAEWKVELTRKGATGLEPSPWYNYIVLPGAMFPWTLFLFVGIIGSSVNTFTRCTETHAGDLRDRIVLALFLLIVPVLVMSFFPDRKLRYLIPLIPPASILAGWAVLELLAPAVRWRHTGKLVGALHWFPLAAATIGLPIAARLGYLKRSDGGPWYSLPFSVVAAIGFALLIAGAIFAGRRWRVGALVVGTLAAMLAWNVVFDLGYRTDRAGRSEMKPLADQILATHPHARICSYRPDRPIRRAPTDLAIYLNRTIANLGDLSELSATSGDRLYLVRLKQAKAPADPATLAPPFGGPWTPFATTPVDDSTWYTFVAK